MTDTALPRTITRPLHLSAIAVACALALITIWAVSAPLATTIRANGTLVSTQPAYELQHPFGGPIAQVHIAPHATVSKGDVLFTLDTALQSKARTLLIEQRALIDAENTAIQQALTGSPISTTHPNITALYTSLSRQTDIDLQTAQETATAAKRRRMATQTGLNLLIERQSTVQTRLNDLKTLLDKGLTTQQTVEMDTDQLLQIKGEINAADINILTLTDQETQANLQSQKRRQEFHTQLQNTRAANNKQRATLDRQILQLDAEIAQANIVAPADGTIVNLGFDTHQMYIPRGQTVATLSQSLDRPRVRVVIPTSAVDQVYTGMTGKLTIPALPQRSLPQINVVLTAISPDAMKDETGSPIGYEATASLSDADIAAVQSSLDGTLRLSSDMPVSLALSGRSITFYDFLIAPFFNAFKQSLQD